MREKITRISELPKPINISMCVNTGEIKMTEYNKLQINKDDIDEVYKAFNGLNIPLVDAAFKDVESKIEDEEKRKLRIDNRVYTILKVWLSAIGIISVAIASNYSKYPILLLVTATILAISVFYLVEAVKGKTYCSKGHFPSDWLYSYYLENNETENEQVVALCKARMIYELQSSLEGSADSNSQRLGLLNKALLLGQVSLLPIFLNLLIEATNLHHFFGFLMV